MLKGYYTLTSGMLTQERKLDVIGNNIANATTPGFKKDQMEGITFREELASRVGSVDKRGSAPLGEVSMVLVPDEAVTDFTQGTFDETGRPLDFALEGDGFFEIRQPDGTMVYTRNGSFTLDAGGNLLLQHVGQVMGPEGPIQLGTDQIRTDSGGTIYSQTGQALGQLRIVDFNDYGTLVKSGEGMFQNNDPQNLIAPDPQTTILDQRIERSNVVSVDEMVGMMSCQRLLQSSGQVLKMYDQIMAKATTELGRV